MVTSYAYLKVLSAAAFLPVAEALSEDLRNISRTTLGVFCGATPVTFGSASRFSIAILQWCGYSSSLMIKIKTNEPIVNQVRCF